MIAERDMALTAVFARPPAPAHQRQLPDPVRRRPRLEPLRPERQVEALLQLLRHQRYYAEGSKAIPAGKHQVRMEFKYDGVGLAKGSGAVNWVQIDLEKDDQDHLVSPEERFKIAMARQ
jgi:hypothetical protein